MTDLSRKPAPGTRAREIYDDEAKRRRRRCPCGSQQIVSNRSNYTTCIACDPETNAQWARMRRATK